jgi:hypothetical protein
MELAGVSLARTACRRLEILAMSCLLANVEAHGAGAAGDGPNCGVEIGGGQVGHLGLGHCLPAERG